MGETKKESMQEHSTEKSQPTFTKPKRGRQITAIIVALVIGLAVVVAVVLAVVLTRKEKRGDGKEEIKMAVLSVTSDRVTYSSVRISITYRAPDEHTTDWLIRYEEADTLRKAGDVRMLTDGGVDSLTITTITIQDIIGVTALFLRIWSSYENVGIHFNVEAMSEKGSSLITEWRNNIIHIDNNVLAPDDSNLTVGIILIVDDKNIIWNQESQNLDNVFFDSTFIFFDALNITSEPPVVFEVVDRLPGKKVFFPKIVSRNGAVVHLKISISADLVQYGGLFTFKIAENSTSKYINKITHGVTINVLSPTTRAVVPANTVGLFPLSNETYIYTKRGSLFCFAMGNPRPIALLFKSGDDGKDNLLSEVEETIRDRYTHMIAYTLERSNLNNEGKYKCRAQSNQTTSESVTVAVFGELPVVDDAGTGVIVNTSEEITIQCKATGTPRPTFQINLFKAFGPDLIKTDLYQVNQSFPDKRTSIVRLTISPPDTAIHTVYCTPVQQDNKRYRMLKRIELFQHDEAKGIDWKMFNRMQNLILGTT